MTELADIRLADAIELAAWEDMVAAAPSALGMRSERIGGALLLVAPQLPTVMFNRVIGLGNDAPATERDLDAIIARYRDAAVPSFWIHIGPATEPAAVPTWLAARGFTRPARAAWAKVLRGAEPPAAVASELVVRRTTPAELPAFAAVIAAAHGMPPPIVPWITALSTRPRWAPFGAFAGAELVAGGMSFVDGERAWLGLAGTSAAHRRRGGQGLVMTARIAHAIAAGCSAIATETGEPIGDEDNPSLRNMLRHGFRRVCARANYQSPVT